MDISRDGTITTTRPTRACGAATRVAMLSLAPEWLDILAALAVQPRTVNELRCELNLPQGGTLGNRLSKMKEAGLVDYTSIGTDARRGHSHLYHLVPEAIVATAEDIRQTARQIEETAEKIESFVARKKKRRSA